MPHSRALLLALTLTAVAVLLGACGEEDARLLPGQTAREITANLDTVQQLSDEGDCVGAESAALQVEEQIAAVEDVEPELKRALEDGAERLGEVIARCEEAPTEAIDPATIPPEEDGEGETDGRDEDEEDESEDEKPRRGGQGREREPGGRGKGNATRPAPQPAPPTGGEGRGPEGGDEGGADDGGPSGGLDPGGPAEGE